MISSAQLSQPTAQDFTIASAEAQAHKTSQPGPSRKRKQGDIEDATGDAVDAGVDAPPQRDGAMAVLQLLNH